MVRTFKRFRDFIEDRGMTTTSTLVNNRYRVVRELGKGGFGATFLVEETLCAEGVDADRE